MDPGNSLGSRWGLGLKGPFDLPPNTLTLQSRGRFKESGVSQLVDVPSQCSFCCFSFFYFCIFRIKSVLNPWRVKLYETQPNRIFLMAEDEVVSSRWCEGEVLCPHVKCSMFIPLLCSLSQIPFDTRALQGPVIPGHWIQIKTSPVFLWRSLQLPPFFLQSVPYSFWKWKGRQTLTAALHKRTANMTSPFKAESRIKHDILTVCVQLLNFYYNILSLVLVKCCVRPCGLVEVFQGGGKERREKENKRERTRCPKAALITNSEPIAGKPSLRAAWIIHMMMSLLTKAVCHSGLFSN